ncbi:unnamed protein product, partial [Effrenium voratum]
GELVPRKSQYAHAWLSVTSLGARQSGRMQRLGCQQSAQISILATTAQIFVEPNREAPASSLFCWLRNSNWVLPASDRF